MAEGTALRHYRKTPFNVRLRKDLSRYWLLYLMVLPVTAYYIIFHYFPIYGVQIAFRDFNATLGYLRSPWVGLKHFRLFTGGLYFRRTVINTFTINVYSLLFSFPMPIVFALLLNELRSKLFKRTVQTISYLPHFISTVVICGMIVDFCLTDGLINDIIELLGGKRFAILQHAQYFRTIYIASGIWQGLGWSSIIYIAAISGVDQELYESASMDGAGRFRQMWHITLPSILPTITILLILRIGNLMNLGFEKIILLYNPATYRVADVISSYVYRQGLQLSNWSYGAAVDMMNAVANVLLLVLANTIAHRVSETSLW